MMKRTAIVATLIFASSTSAYGADRIGEDCRGSETIQIGDQRPRTVEYALVFSVDVKTKSYCYAECRPEQSYFVKDIDAKPMKLAEFADSRQVRRLIFDQVSQRLTDYQVFDAGVGKIVRNASAICRRSLFHQPMAVAAVR